MHKKVLMPHRASLRLIGRRLAPSGVASPHRASPRPIGRRLAPTGAALPQRVPPCPIGCYRAPSVVALPHRASIRPSGVASLHRASPRPVFVACVYRHPGSDISIEDVINLHISPILKRISIENKQCVLMGDFNVDLLKINSDNQSNEFYNSLSSKFFTPFILQPTRLHSNTIIDNIIFVLSGK